MSHKKDSKIGKDLKRILCVSSLSILILVGIMVFSPLAMQFDDDGLSRGAFNKEEIDSLVLSKEYQMALNKVDSCIAEKSQNLPRFAYFDRFFSDKKKRYETNVLRSQVYDLQWKRIEILLAKKDYATLKSALQDYSRIIGYNQNQAIDLLSQIKDR